MLKRSARRLCWFCNRCNKKWCPLGIDIGTFPLQHLLIKPSTTIAKKFAYAGDLVIKHSTKDWKALEKAASQVMATL